jgi:hypothetical protein
MPRRNCYRKVISFPEATSAKQLSGERAVDKQEDAVTSGARAKNDLYRGTS